MAVEWVVQAVYTSRDNILVFELLDEGAEIPDYSSLTRMLLTMTGTTVYEVDSAVNPELFSVANGRVEISVGLSAVEVGEYVARFDTWDPTNTNGIVWVNDLPVTVHA